MNSNPVKFRKSHRGNNNLNHCGLGALERGFMGHARVRESVVTTTKFLIDYGISVLVYFFLF